MEHKIRDFPLAMPRVKPQPAKKAEGKKEEWVTFGCKEKPSFNHLAPKKSYAVVTIIPPIPTGVSTPASMERPADSTAIVLGVSQVSNPACL